MEKKLIADTQKEGGNGRIKQERKVPDKLIGEDWLIVIADSKLTDPERMETGQSQSVNQWKAAIFTSPATL